MSDPSAKFRLSNGQTEQDLQAAIAEFIRTRGVTRCPTACLLPTQAFADVERTPGAREPSRLPESGGTGNDSLRRAPERP